MEKFTYLDFDLLIQRDGEHYRAQVINSPAGQAASTFGIPFSDIELENFLLKIGRPRRGTRRVDAPEVEAAKSFGERLFAAVFNGDVRGCLRSSMDEARRQNSGLRIRLRLTEVPELADLPWEYLYSAPPVNRFFALSNKSPLVRYLHLPEVIHPLVVTAPLRMVVMISSPRDFPSLDVEREWANLREALADLEQRGLVELKRLDSATPMALQHQLRRGQYHIFHFIGHGGFNKQNQDGMLILEDQQGKGSPVSGQILGALLHDHYPMRLVVLNACEGARSSSTDPFAGLAQSLIQQGVPAVIAMQFEITDEAAISFAREFYSALADAYPVDAAITEARKTIFTQGNGLEWGTPVLYMRAPDGRIFDIKEMSEAERRQLQITTLSRDAKIAMKGEDWTLAIEKLQELLILAPSHAEASVELHEANQQNELATLYTKALEIYKANKWRQALQCFEQVQKIRPGYKDVQIRIENARHELARIGEEERKQAEVTTLRMQAETSIKEERWPEAIERLQGLLALDPSNTEAIEKLEQARQEHELAGLYVQGCEHFDSRHWREALACFQQVSAKRASHKDVSALTETVQLRLAGEDERQQQAEIPALHNSPQKALGESPREGDRGHGRERRRWLLAREAKLMLGGIGIPALLLLVWLMTAGESTPTELISLGDGFVEKKSWAEAESAYRKAVALEPTDYWYKFKLWTMLDRQRKLAEGNAIKAEIYRHKNWEVAERESRRMLQAEPRKAFRHADLAQVLFSQHKYAEAEVEHRKAVEIDPKELWYYLDLANDLSRQSKHAEAEYQCGRAIEIDPKDGYVCMGRALSRQNRYTEAEAQYKKAIEISPRDAAVYVALGSVLSSQEKDAEAEAQYNKAVEIDPKNARGYGGLGVVLSRQRKYAEAEAQCRQAMEVDRNDTFGYCGLGYALARQNRYLEAESQYRKALVIDPNDWYGHFGLGASLMQQTKFAEAESQYREAIEIDPNDTDGYIGLGEALSRQEKYSEAETRYRKAIEIDPRVANICTLSFAAALFNQKKYADAEAEYRRATKILPTNATGYIGLGNALFHQQKYAAAEASYREAREIDPTNAIIALANVLFQQQKYAEAEAKYREATKNAPTAASGYIGLGNVRFNQQKYAEAAAQYRRATEIDPKNEIAQKNLANALSRQKKKVDATVDPKSPKAFEKSRAK